MKTFPHNLMAGVLGALLFTLAGSSIAFAQDTPTESAHASSTMGAMHGDDMQSGHHKYGHHDMDDMHKHMMGMHAMPGTVSSVDKQTGLVEVNAEGMMLKLHFPTAAVANLQTGDKITVHMGFSKP
jgi:hypothetical protein